MSSKPKLSKQELDSITSDDIVRLVGHAPPPATWFREMGEMPDCIVFPRGTYLSWRERWHKGTGRWPSPTE